MNNNGSANHLESNDERSESGQFVEHRTNRRHQFSALAEVIEPRTRTRLTCRATDLSLGGSYVDTISPFAAGTNVMIRFSCENRSFQTSARVTYSLNGMGMGLAFAPDMPAEQAAALHSWIAELSGDSETGPTLSFETAPPGQTQEYSSVADENARLREFARDLIEILWHKQMLTEPEVNALRSKLVRSAR